MKLTFRDFTWRSNHHIPHKHGAASLPHWHSYKARLWFCGDVDQDWLVNELERTFSGFHGSALNGVMPDTSDEGIAEWMMQKATQSIAPCVRVVVENDGNRGAEVCYFHNAQ